MADKKKAAKGKTEADTLSDAVDPVTEAASVPETEDAPTDPVARDLAETEEDHPNAWDAPDPAADDHEMSEGLTDAAEPPEPEVAEFESDTRADVPGAIYARTQEAEPQHAAVVKTEQVFVRQGGFWSMLLGGVVAAGVGVAAAPYVLPPAWFSNSNEGVEAALSAQNERLAALSAELQGLESPPDLSGEMGGLSETLTALTGQMSELEGRLSALEERPAAQGDSVPSAELEDLRAALAAQASEIEALRGAADAEEAAARDSAVATLRRAALTRVMTALDSGSDFAPALTDLRDTGAEVPDVLADQADTGVPTQAALVESFPEAARAALATARAESGDTVAGVGGFLKSQLGIRSLNPQEGDDPDAVLSRAEAALIEERLADALAEIESLPEAARATMQDWVAEATRRQEALAAAEALAGTLN
ncbi:hypothetical protein ACSSVY_000242 [Roseovarius sp. MBR-51]